MRLRARGRIGGAEERAQIRGELFHSRFRAIEGANLVAVHTGEPLALGDQQHEAHHHGGHQQEQKKRCNEGNSFLFSHELCLQSRMLSPVIYNC
jgi:hypothetical protein